MPQEQKLYTIAEFARRFKIPESTARFYCKRFVDFLPHAGSGKRKRYLPEALERFKLITTSMRKQKNADAVEALLVGSYGNPGTAVEYGPGERNAGAQDALQGAAAGTEFMSSQGLCGPAMPSAPFAQNGTAGAAAEVLEKQVAALEKLSDSLEKIASDGNSVTTLTRDLAEVKAEVAAVKAEVLAIRDQMAEAEQLHQHDLEQLRKWLHHLAREQSRK